MASPSTTVEFSDDWDDPGWFRFPRTIARDNRLSLKAKGVAVLLASHKAKTFVFSASELQKWSKDGKAATNAALQELEAAGYLVRLRQSSGSMVYRLFVQPQTENQEQAGQEVHPENPPAENPLPENRDVYKKTTPKETTRGEEQKDPKISLTSGAGEIRSGSSAQITITANGETSLPLPHDVSAFGFAESTPAGDGKPSETELLAGFEEWWKLYPRKIGKKAAQTAYLRVLRKQKTRDAARELWQQLMAGVRRYAQERAGQDPQFTAHGQTWLNQGRWEDEPSTPQNQTRPAWHADDDRWANYDISEDLRAAREATDGGEEPAPDLFGIRL